MATKHYKLVKYGVWVLLSAPAIYTFVRYFTDDISYGQVIHETGDWSIGLLCIALSATPILRLGYLLNERLSKKAKWPRWLMNHRRAIGVASFGYAAIHTVTYLERKWGYGYIQKEALEPGLMTGWIALLVFLLLAVTSNNSSVRKLKRKWQQLHRTVYLATGLAFAHWVLTAFEPRAAYLCLAAICLIEALRFVKVKPTP